jgi:hypothetical protein
MLYSQIVISLFFSLGVSATSLWLPDLIQPRKNQGKDSNEIALVPGGGPFIDPFLDIARVWDRLDQALYHQIMGPIMSLDSKETKTGYEMHVDLPGVKKDDISLSVKGLTCWFKLARLIVFLMIRQCFDDFGSQRRYG